MALRKKDPSAVRRVVELSKELGGEGFEDMQEQEVLKLVMPGSETSSAQDVEKRAQLVGQKKSSLPQPEEDMEKNSIRNPLSKSGTKCY